MKRGWFSDVDTEAPESHQWQPCFKADEGHIPAFEVWFATKEECDSWIRERVIGAGMLDDDA